MSKYEPLQRFLNRVDGDHWKPTFLELERMLGFDLPALARKRQSWWTAGPSGRGAHAAAWTEAGWSVHDVDLEKQTVNFLRDGSAAALNAGAPAFEPPPRLRDRIADQRDRLVAQRDAAARQAARQWEERPLAVISVSAAVLFVAGVGLGYLVMRSARGPAGEAFEAAESSARRALRRLGERAHGVEDMVRSARAPAVEAFEAAENRARKAMALLGERAHEVEAALAERIRRLRG
jgi:ElaB/YqjD/DUF883 family membrane-anchored ribosome-binding protein